MTTEKRYFFIKRSGNRKTGKIPVTTSQSRTCPDACPLKKNGCYGEGYPMCLHLRKLNNGTRGIDQIDFLNNINKLDKNTFWRHNQYGDLEGANDQISQKDLLLLVAANKGKKGFTYTHYPVDSGDHKGNANLVDFVNNKTDFTINLSANNLKHADQLADLNIGPVVTILTKEQAASKKVKTPAGKTVSMCPAQLKEDITCKTCKLCANKKRNIIGFTVHGRDSKKATSVVNNY